MSRLGRDGRRRPTIDDVARSAGVSKGAVSLALNGRPGVSEATRGRIVAAAEALGWRPSARAKALSESRALAVGMVVAGAPAALSADPSFAALLAGVDGELATAGYALVLSVAADAEAELAAYRRLADDGRVDGVLLTGARADDPRYALLAELGLEAVVVGPANRRAGLPGVAADERAVLRRVVRALVELGHRDIGHVAGPAALVHAAERQRAWAAALAAAGLPPGPVADSDLTPTGGARATRRLLESSRPPTAIVYADDVMAIAGIRVARELELRVPEDLSIVGFGDLPLAAHVDPPLTTIRSHPVAAGAAAAKLLLQRLRGEPASVPALPEPELVDRASMAPAARVPVAVT